MTRSKTNAFSNANDLYLNFPSSKFCVILFLITSIVTTFDIISFIENEGSDICPITNFCHTNASKIVNSGKKIPCCLPCSCSETCWEIGNCCPDKDTAGKNMVTELSCKPTFVKGNMIHVQQDFWYEYTVGIERYRVYDKCALSEENKTLLQLCDAENKTTLDDYQWVSDNAGRVFQNRFCALCNNVTNFIVWEIQTSCLKVLRANRSRLEQLLLSEPSCEINLKVPESERALTKQYRCFKSFFKHCNETGKWKHFNASIAEACETYDSPVIGSSSLVIPYLPIFKNIYCFVCNVDKENMPIQTMCLDLFTGTFGRKPLEDPFSILIDWKTMEKIEETDENKPCDVHEMYDYFTKRCLEFSCPLGSNAYYGECLTTATYIRNLHLTVWYNLRDMSISNMSQVELDQHISDNLKHFTVGHFRDSFGDCCTCGEQFRSYKNIQTRASRDYYLAYTFYTTDVCQLDNILQLAETSNGKELTITLNETFSLNFTVRLVNKPASIMQTISFSWSPSLCFSHFTLEKSQICPSVWINSSEIKTLKKEILYLDIVDNNDESDIALINVCWNQYQMMMMNSRSNHINPLVKLIAVVLVFSATSQSTLL